MRKYFDFIACVFSLTLLFFFLNDLQGLLSPGKWDGLLCCVCKEQCLILIDKIAVAVCAVLFVLLATVVVRKYKWRFLYVPPLAVGTWILIMLLHLFIVWMFVL